jgi:hypothetical protein
MKISMLFRILFCALAATTFAAGAFAQSAAGLIRAAKVEGPVTKIQANGTSTPLKNGDSLTETDAVLTGKGASVVLVFANGSSVKVGADSRLAIDEFKMDPLDEDIKPAELKEEKSVSQTKLNLAYGEMVGSVKKLNTASSYSIKTPVGAAGIRGTIFRIVFRPSADGKAFFTVSTAEGKVVMEGVTTSEVPVEAGKEVVVEVNTDDPGHPKIVTQNISDATMTLIGNAAQTITEALGDIVIPPGGGSPPPGGPPPTTDTTNAAPNLTPGAGGSH